MSPPLSATFGLVVTLTFDLVLRKISEPPKTHPYQLKLSSFNILWYENGSKVVYDHIWSGCDLLTSKSSQLIIVLKRRKVVNLTVNLPEVVYEILCSLDERINTHTDCLKRYCLHHLRWESYKKLIKRCDTQSTRDIGSYV